MSVYGCDWLQSSWEDKEENEVEEKRFNFQTAAEATTNKSEGYRWLAYDLLRNTLEGHLGNQLQSDVRVDAS